ncbi:MAG: insulinase family protein [Muribaculaceae bacterium]|nr:insulinase family protein [Muribaculaceae bacterium]
MITNSIKLILAASALIPFGMQAAAPEVTSGTLPNGLRYYIRHNQSPAGRADFFVSRGFGSLVENDDEQGMAHFLEHMCFNGTEHFPGNSMIDWLATLGVKFGADLNAYTSMEETVYNISKVPVARESAVDSCLLVLRDWSTALTLADADIYAERGVVKGEWRQRTGAASRMLEKAAPQLYPGSPYGNRMPIGKMEVVENFPPQKLRAFYRKWHRPDTEAIIVVGDIDPVAVEQKIIATFSEIPLQSGSPALPRFTVAPNENLISIVESDPEQAYSAVTLYYKHLDPDALSDRERVRRKLLGDICLDLLVERIDDAELRPDAPYSKTGIGNSRFLLASTMDALMLRTIAKSGREAESVKSLHSEIERARTLGFTADEFTDAVDKARGKAASDRDKAATRSNTDLARELSRHYLQGTPVSDPDRDYELVMEILPTLTPEDARDYLADITALPAEGRSGQGHVALLYVPSNRPTPPPTPQDITAAYESVDPATLTPFEYLSTDGTLLAEEPARGLVVGSEPGEVDGTVVYTLSNGIRAVARKSAEKPGQVLVRGIGPGGFSQNYNPADAASIKLFEDAMALAGAGEHSQSDLRRLLKGRDIKTSVSVSNTDETLELATTAADLEDGFRLLWLKATALRPDSAAFASRIASRVTQMEGRQHSAIHVMGDSITRNVYDHHPLGGHPDLQAVRNADYSRILDIHADRFSDFSDFTFYIVGDFDEEQLRDLLARYVASLPAAGRVEKPKDICYHFSPTSVRHRFSEPMENPQAIVYQFRHADCPYSRRNLMLTQMTWDVLRSRLLADIREDKGWVYSIKGHTSLIAGINGDDPSQFMMPTYIKTSVEHADEVAAAVGNTIAAMAKEITPAELDKVKESMLRDAADNRSDNAYWLSVMKGYDRYGIDYDRDYETELSTLTPVDLSKFVGTYVVPAITVDLLMTPAE